MTEGLDPIIEACAKTLMSMPDPWPYLGAYHVAGIVVGTAKPLILSEHREESMKRRRAWEAEIPPGWYPFGTHTNGGLDGIELVFSDELDEDMFPKWERLQVVEGR